MSVRLHEDKIQMVFEIMLRGKMWINLVPISGSETRSKMET